MKMPDDINIKMLASCGMNCIVCYKHLITKKYAKKCNGCKYDDETLPEHCRKCKIKDCAKSKHLEYCFQCEEYPCKRIKNLDKSYVQKYKTSLIDNGLFIKEKGIVVFLEHEKKKWACLDCNGIISLHDRFCSECKKSIK
ncbi:DUF3795 domain-containing protein [Thomasclavelia sp.]